jgi:hypothetical protein
LSTPPIGVSSTASASLLRFLTILTVVSRNYLLRRKIQDVPPQDDAVPVTPPATLIISAHTIPNQLISLAKVGKIVTVPLQTDSPFLWELSSFGSLDIENIHLCFTSCCTSNNSKWQLKMHLRMSRTRPSIRSSLLTLGAQAFCLVVAKGLADRDSDRSILT